MIVIGGGVMGASTAYHLARAGLQNVVLLERRQLTCGTTWHSAAQVRQLRSTENLTRLIQYSARLYASLEAETGQSTGWLKTGSLSIATNKDRRTHIRRQADLAAAFDVAAEIIGPEKLLEHWPVIEAGDVLEAVWSPDDGRVNPSDLVSALVKGGRAHGLTVCENTPVTGFGIRNGRIASVNTPHGEIACEAVVNCAGLWGRDLAALVGVPCPLYACEHFYLLTKPIADGLPHLPTLSDHDGCLYIRDDVGGLLVGCFEPNPKPIALKNLPKDFCFDLLNEDWDHFEPMMMNAMHRIPALESAEARMLLNGPESFTPDGAFLMGESPALPGFFLGCGMNSMGVASGGGAGMALAQWIVEGAPPMDLTPVDARRFSAFHNNIHYLRQRIPETLALHYAISYPGREPETARNARTSPLHQTLALQGAHFVERSGWERPGWFDAEAIGAEGSNRNPFPLRFGKPSWHAFVAGEHLAARENVAIFDQSSFGKIQVCGPDAESYLQRVCANNLAVEPGRCVYTQMLNAGGGIESDLVAMRISGNGYLLITGTAQLTRDLAWLQRHLNGSEHVTFTDMTPAWAVISVAGPRSRDLLSDVSMNDFSDAAFRRFHLRQVEIGSAPALAARLSYTGELGWELYVTSDQARNVYQSLMSAGIAPAATSAGIYALTSLRIEKGFRAWGHDIGPADSPLDAGLGFAVDFDKAIPFNGRDALLRQRDKTPVRALASILMERSDVFIQGHEPLMVDGEIAGQVTSATFGHSVGKPVALGWLRGEAAASLQNDRSLRIEVQVAGEAHAGVATLRPPV